MQPILAQDHTLIPLKNISTVVSNLLHVGTPFVPLTSILHLHPNIDVTPILKCYVYLEYFASVKCKRRQAASWVFTFRLKK